MLVYDQQGQGLGGCYGAGKEPFEVAEVELTRPLESMLLAASAAARGHDDFEAPAAHRRLVL